MDHTQQSIHHNEQRIASDIAIRTQQAEERRQMDASLTVMGRVWEGRRLSTMSSCHNTMVNLNEEVYVVVDLTSNDLDSCAFVVSIFPYKSGDRCVWFDLERAQAVLHLTRIAATSEQLDILEHTGTIVAYAFKTRAEVAQCFPTLFNHTIREDEAKDMTPEEALAKFFHDTYERLAPEYCYQTRASSAVSWPEVPANNKQLMIAVCREVVVNYFGNEVEA